MKILVRNLARTTTENSIRSLFSGHGLVTQCTLVLDQESGLSKGFAFVEMPEIKEAKSAIAALNKITLDENRIRVKNAEC